MIGFDLGDKGRFNRQGVPAVPSSWLLFHEEHLGINTFAAVSVMGRWMHGSSGVAAGRAVRKKEAPYP